MTELEKMKKGLLYDCNDKSILDEQFKAFNKFLDYDKLEYGDFSKRQKLIKECAKECGKNVIMMSPVRSNFGLLHVSIGDNFYSNFNLTLVDDGNITIGNDVLIGPNVTIVTAAHPIEPTLRKKVLQFNKDIIISDGVWIGANVTILPGVKIGKNSVIGAGSLVTKDIPDNVVAFGSPCKVYREISDRDKEYFYKNEKIDYSEIK